MVTICDGVRILVYPSFGGIGGIIIGFDGEDTLSARKLLKLVRALYSGRVMISFSFCCRSLSRRPV